MFPSSTSGTNMRLFAESEQGALALVRAVFFPGQSVAGPDDYHVLDMKVVALPAAGLLLEGLSTLPPKGWQIEVVFTAGVHRHAAAMTVTVWQLPKEGD